MTGDPGMSLHSLDQAVASESGLRAIGLESDVKISVI